MKYNTNKSILATAVLAALASANSANAQLEEVVVTAEFREANIQDTPIAIEAFNSDDIRKRGIVNVKDLFNSAAGVVGYEKPTGAGSISLNIRGIGSGNPTLWQDPANAIYVDGVYVGKGIGNSVDALDLERIEILRGPQGTLYGRNSTGGAVNFITQKPGEETTGSLVVSAGNYGYSSIQGRYSAPLSDTLSFAASFQTRERDPFFDNTNTQAEDFQGLNRDSYRLAVRWTPSDRLTADYSFSRSEVDENTVMLKTDGFYPTAAAVASTPGFPDQVSFDSSSRKQTIQGLAGAVQNFVLPNAPLPQVQQFLDWSNDYVAWFDAKQARFGSSDGGGSSDVSNRSAGEVDMHSLSLTWDLSDTMQVKSITGYRDTTANSSTDIDGMDNRVNGGVLHDTVLQTIGAAFLGALPFPPQLNQFSFALSMIDGINEYGSTPLYSLPREQDEYTQFSQEIQLIGEFDKVRYVAGVYYYDDSSEFRDIRSFSFPLAYSDSTSFDLDSEAMALFGEVTWDLGNLALTAGLRYTEETKDVTYLHRSMPATFDRLFGSIFSGGSVSDFDWAASYVSANAPLESIPEASYFGQKASQDFDNLSGRLTAQYYFNDQVNVYGTFSTGYRSGGFNGSSYTPGVGPDAFDEETIENIEVGLKSTLLDGRARLNAALFRYEYTDLQVNGVSEQNGALVSGINNAGSTTRDGLEVALTWQLLDNLVANISWTTINGDFDNYPDNVAPNGTAQDVSNLARRGLSPDDQVTYSFDWRLFETAVSSVNWNINGAWQSDTQALLVETDVIGGVPVAMATRQIEERNLLNTRVSWDYQLSSGSMLSVGAFAMNVTDEDYRTFGYGLRSGIGTNTQMYGAPRTYGLDVSYSF